MKKGISWDISRVQNKSLKRGLNFYQQDIPYKYNAAYTAEAVMVCIVVAWLFYNNPAVACFFIWVIPLYVKYRSSIYIKKRKQKLLSDFAEGISSVLIGLNAGYSVENAFIDAIPQLEQLCGKDAEVTLFFRQIKHQISINRNIEDVMLEYAENTGLEDIQSFAQVFRYAKRRGGDMNGIISYTIVSIRDKADIMREINTMISGKQFEQMIMDVVPMGIILYLRITSPELVGSMYGSFMGILMMTGCIAVYMVAVVLSVRIVNIKI